MSDNARILVVEDEPLSREMLIRRLTDRGFDAVALGSADEALVYLESNSVDLVLMDNMVPGTSGVDAVRQLRRSWSHDSLPIIMISGMVDSDDVVVALEAGANDYVVKPINFRVLLARIDTALTLRRNITALLEAERQRVMMRSLAGAAARVAEPLGKMIDELEIALKTTNDPRETTVHLHGLLDLTEKAVDVIEQLRNIASMQDVPFVARLDILRGPPNPEE